MLSKQFLNNFKDRPVMIIAEERNTLRILFDNPDDGETTISQHIFISLSLRSRYNPELSYYVVDCSDYIRYGLTSSEVLDVIKQKYIASKYKNIDSLFSCIYRI